MYCVVNVQDTNENKSNNLYIQAIVNTYFQLKFYNLIHIYILDILLPISDQISLMWTPKIKYSIFFKQSNDSLKSKTIIISQELQEVEMTSVRKFPKAFLLWLLSLAWFCHLPHHLDLSLRFYTLPRFLFRCIWLLPEIRNAYIYL